MRMVDTWRLLENKVKTCVKVKREVRTETALMQARPDPVISDLKATFFLFLSGTNTTTLHNRYKTEEPPRAST